MTEMANPHEPKNLLEEFSLPNMGITVHLKAIRLNRVNAASGWSYPQHEHPQFEINLQIEGDLVVKLNGGSVNVQAGDLLLIPPGIRHSFLAGNSREFTHFFLHFDIDDKLFLPLLQGARNVLFPSDSILTQRVRPVLDRMAELTKLPEPLSIAKRMQVHSAVFDLFAALGESLTSINENQPTSDKRTVQLAYDIAEQIKRSVKAGIFHDDYERTREGIEDIARSVNISPSHCNRIFQRIYGISPRQYLSDLRLKEAQRLLQTDLQVVHISSLLGYREISHFSQQFKRWTGLTPTQYRQKT